MRERTLAQAPWRLPFVGILLLNTFLLTTVLLTPELAAQQEPVPASARKIKAKLDRGIRGDRQHEVFVRMTDQVLVTAVDYPTFCRENAGAKRGELRKQVIADLKKKADTSWKLVRKTVAKLEKEDEVSGVRRYFIVNGFGCMATTDACRKLAENPAVGFLYRKPRGLPSVAKSGGRGRGRGRRIGRGGGGKQALERAIKMWDKGAQQVFDPDRVAPFWNLKRIQADQAWKKEQTIGKGITIALIDSGILLTPPLITALWRNEKEKLNGKDDDGNGYVDDIFGWDFQSRSGNVIGDPGGHGSMCGGIMAGRPVDGGDKKGGKKIVTGIAPGARLMIIRGMGLLLAYEYALDNGADVVSMSYMWVNRPLGNWRGLYRLAHEHMTIAGIVSVGGAGNFSRLPEGKQIALPKDIPCVVAAAGLNKRMKKARASSEGPCYWDDVVFYNDYGKHDPLRKPDVTGFFTDYPVWINLAGRFGRRARNLVYEGDDGCGLIVGPGGNSFSGPHAGGVAALMLSANRDLPAWRVIELMMKTCKDIGPKGHDTRFGAGLLQALKGVRAAKKAKAGRSPAKKQGK